MELPRRRGRPNKKNAKKPGELKEGETYFNFIAIEEKKNSVKELSKTTGKSIKELMDEALNTLLFNYNLVEGRKSQKDKELLLMFTMANKKLGTVETTPSAKKRTPVKKYKKKESVKETKEQRRQAKTNFTVVSKNAKYMGR
jgi:hypothetical protein